MKLDATFYQSEDVVQVARDLLGMVLVTHFEGQLTSGRITETEAYRAPDDRACHAWNNRLTPRTAVMFGAGGSAYIYLCYGLHQMFNVVTGPQDMAHAVLIRAVEPLEGINTMLERRGYRQVKPALTTGPGAVGQALGLHTRWSGQRLYADETPIWLEDRGIRPAASDIAAGARIGVAYAGECAQWPWRFWIKGTPYYKKG